jgi:hypothetical protein
MKSGNGGVTKQCARMSLQCRPCASRQATCMPASRPRYARVDSGVSESMLEAAEFVARSKNAKVCGSYVPNRFLGLDFAPQVNFMP